MPWKLAATFGLATSCGLFAQPAQAPLTFEVASIKPSAPAGSGRIAMGIQLLPGGGLRASNTTLRVLVGLAYDVRDFQITGGPGWIGSDRYDVQARSERAPDTPASPEDPRNVAEEQRKTMQEQMRERLRALLAERFQLVIHHETKEAPVYALVVAKGGPKLQESKDHQSRLRLGRGEWNGEGVTMQFVAQALSNQLQRPVLDKTGLKGNYDIKLTWTPEPGQIFGPPGGPPPGVEPPPPADPNGPTIFTAVQEQLGLRLESQRGPVDMIVIDDVEKPSEN